MATPSGCYELAQSINVIAELEMFLQVVEDQRTKHLQRNPALKHDAVFTASDMQEINKCWVDDHETWLNQKTLETCNGLLASLNKRDQGNAHQMRRNALSAFLFQFLVNNHFLLAAIQYFLRSAAQPACVVQQFMQAWEHERASESTRKECRSPTGRRRNAET